MARRQPQLDTLCELHDSQRIEVGSRTLTEVGPNSIQTVIPAEICSSRGLQAGDKVLIEFDKEREEIVIPIDKVEEGK